ncbi:MAG: hypothetical protein JXB32_07870 [Deltaproteobacteria bacterium]|nr:hypothetical protein [Deltaproteobacteria bacterium]
MTRGGSSPPPRTLAWLPALLAVAAGCPPAGPGPTGPVGTTRAPDADDGEPDPLEPPPDDAGPPDVERPVELSPCMSAEDVLAWSRGRGAEVVVEALARHLTDLTPADIPEVPPDRVAGWVRSFDAAPLVSPTCASLVVTLWFDPRIYLTERAGIGEARAVAIFSPALTEPAVAHAVCVDGRETCRILRLEDLDGDDRNDLLVERTRLGADLPPAQTLYVFPEDSDPLPVWISDDDAVRRALFDAAGETDAGNQAALTDVSFESVDGHPTIRADYRLLVCDDRAAAPAERCASTGDRTLVFTRLGDVYLLPDEPEPGAPWGRPE